MLDFNPSPSPSFLPPAAYNDHPVVEVVNGKPATTSLQVAAFFGKQHKNVLQDIRNILEAVRESTGLNFEPSEYKDSTGRTLPMYLMDKDAFSLLVMGYTGEEAMRFKLAYIRRFNEMEQQLRVGIPDFSDPVIAARAWADAQEQKRLAEKQAYALEAQAERDRPKVIFADSIEVSEKAISVGSMAKLIKQSTGYDTGQNRFYVWLGENEYVHKGGADRHMPTQRSIDAGWMSTKTGSRMRSNGKSEPTRTTVITGKGQIYFINKFKSLANNENKPHAHLPPHWHEGDSAMSQAENSPAS